ncbi:MAG: cytoplasmic protein [Bacteroidales bacterium]|jgi:hypothetical protein|nr:cytoplasmic protein [Bacteroidales bacterium]
MKDIKAAHKYSSNHKPEIIKDNICGCFYCLEIFNPKEIEFWIEDVKGTAICPYCGIDSIIGESSGFPINTDFLKRMNQYWFG